MHRPRPILLIAAVLLILSVLYFGISLILFQSLARVSPRCDGRFPDNTPAHFTAIPFSDTFDTTPYWMPDYQTVSIPSQPEGVEVSAWYVPGENPDSPAVIVVHGLGDCKQQPRSLLPAGMLHRAGYAVLLIDLREHGDSTVVDGLWAGGTDEFQDVIAAWNWLVESQHLDPARIGLVAYSGGTPATLIAMQHEPRMAAVWLDSPFANLQTTIADQLYARGIPLLFLPGGLLFARLSGLDWASIDLTAVVAQIDTRPIFITHGSADQSLNVAYSAQLAEAIEADGGNVELWITQGTSHVRSMFDQTSEYERRMVAFFNAHL